MTRRLRRRGAPSLSRRSYKRGARGALLSSSKQRHSSKQAAWQKEHAQHGASEPRPQALAVASLFGNLRADGTCHCSSMQWRGAREAHEGDHQVRVTTYSFPTQRAVGLARGTSLGRKPAALARICASGALDVKPLPCSTLLRGLLRFALQPAAARSRRSFGRSPPPSPSCRCSRSHVRCPPPPFSAAAPTMPHGCRCRCIHTGANTYNAWLFHFRAAHLQTCFSRGWIE